MLYIWRVLSDVSINYEEDVLNAYNLEIIQN